MVPAIYDFQRKFGGKRFEPDIQAADLDERRNGKRFDPKQGVKFGWDKKRTYHKAWILLIYLPLRI
jgi:hypothetical protein